MNCFITKAQASRLIEPGENLPQKATRAGIGNEFHLLRTGAKLATTRVGSVVRYVICGYSQDGKDVTDVLDGLAASC